MISQRMPRITLGASLSVEQFAQALAFTYLSKYSGEAIQPRVLTAFQRAWGVDEIIQLAPGVDNNPGATLAFWNGNGLRHCLVAMHGASAFPSLYSILNDLSYMTVDGCTGSVLGAFRTRAYTMWARLFDNATFVAALANPRCMFTFTGHSLGAAMAELIAYRFKAANPSRTVQCIKFGSPRVGTLPWRHHRNERVNFASVYHDRDPIYEFPQVFSPADGFFVSINSNLTRQFAMDQGIWRIVYGHGAHFSGQYRDFSVWTAANYAALAAQPHTFTNAWYDHSLGSYRTAFMNYCAARPDVLKYRFNYLEFNNENMMQVLFEPGIREWEELHWLNQTQPAEVRPISSDVGLVANAPEVLQQVRPISREDRNSLGGGANDWGQGTPVSVANLPRRIVRQAPVNPVP